MAWRRALRGAAAGWRGAAPLAAAGAVLVASRRFRSPAQLLDSRDEDRLEKQVAPQQAPIGCGHFAGKTAVVTGGGSGLGEAICKKLAAEGAYVFVADVSGEAAERVASEIPNGLAVCTDVSKNDEVEALMNHVAKMSGGRVDILVNNAGVTGAQVPMHKHPISNFERDMAVNCHGAFYVLRAGLAQMMAQEPSGGVVVNMASVVGLTSLGNDIPGYQIAKAGLTALTKTAAVHYAHKGIRVVGVAPSVVMTPLVREHTKHQSADARKALESFNPKPGIVEPVDVANAVAFLCSEEARWINGHIMPVDGAFVVSTRRPNAAVE